MFRGPPPCGWRADGLGYKPNDRFKAYLAAMYPGFFGGQQPTPLPSPMFPGYGNPFFQPGPSPPFYAGNPYSAPFMQPGPGFTPPGMAFVPAMPACGLPMPAVAAPFGLPVTPIEPRCAKGPDPYPAPPGARPPPPRRRGIQYLYPLKHTFIHVVNASRFPEPWNNPGKCFKYEIYQVSCGVSIPGLVKLLGGGKEDVITEFVEKGDGEWEKGMTYDQAGLRGDESVSFFGWGEKRGTEQNPVCIQMHGKEEEKKKEG